MKKTFYSEFSYLCGILTLNLGIALTDRANFGMGMLIAPVYILQTKLSEFFPWLTLGMAQYIFQFFLILLLFLIIRKFNGKFFLSFATAFIDGMVLDLLIYLLKFIPNFGIADQIISFILGMFITSLGVAFFFNTYFAPEAYELLVKEISRKYNFKMTVVKWVYDITSLVVSVILSFCIFGFMKFVGVYWGTLILAVCNGFIIGFFCKFLTRHFEFKDKFNWRGFFEN